MSESAIAVGRPEKAGPDSKMLLGPNRAAIVCSASPYQESSPEDCTERTVSMAGTSLKHSCGGTKT